MPKNKPIEEQTDDEIMEKIYSSQQTRDALDQLHDENMKAMFTDEEWMAEQIFLTQHQNQ